MAGKEKQRECPREAFVREKIPFGETKHSVLRSIMKSVMMKLDPEVDTKATVRQMVHQEFTSRDIPSMLSFEKESEESRMCVLISRALFYMHIYRYNVIKRDFANEVPFAGGKKQKTVHWLVDRGTCYEAIQFRYKAPEYSYRARSAAAKPEYSADLLLLQRAGEEEVRKRGVDPQNKPVYGAIYYLKNKDDTAQHFESDFDNILGNNIISHCFTKNEAAEVEARYQSVSVPDVNVTCDESECKDCLYNDLCHLEFEKRHLMERPPVELKTIDEIRLTDAQEMFVGFENGECRVNAVAGSGKTTVVALRTISLIESGEDPSKILMVTFSEKAKEEMAIRLRSFAEGAMMQFEDLNVSDVQIETFNSWGQHILDKYYATLGFSDKPTLIDDVTKKNIIIELLEKHKKLPLDYRNPFMSTRMAEGAVVRMVKFLDAMKAAHVETETHVKQALVAKYRELDSYEAELLTIYQEYNAQLLGLNLIDYEDQLRLLLKLKDFGIFERLPYEHIVVDEFQDSNPNQIAIIVELKRRNPNIKSLVVVGDELQASVMRF